MPLQQDLWTLGLMSLFFLAMHLVRRSHSSYGLTRTRYLGLHLNGVLIS